MCRALSGQTENIASASENKPLPSEDIEPKRTQSTRVKAASICTKEKDKIVVTTRALNNTVIR